MLASEKKLEHVSLLESILSDELKSEKTLSVKLALQCVANIQHPDLNEPFFERVLQLLIEPCAKALLQQDRFQRNFRRRATECGAVFLEDRPFMPSHRDSFERDF